ncbi:hypothetical protein A2U01_0002226 [Trifolium medium]|uniref:Uncharacterized protein n=1 Tax=Trifolium medium TaxID=97028 RepID=A0A392M2I5_9FABA|nr:hypothetical protein [Trifolium medium]
MKGKLQQAQSNLVGKPTCLKMVEALKGGQGKGHKKKNKKGENQIAKGSSKIVEDSITSTQSENYRPAKVIGSVGIPETNNYSGLDILLSTEDHEGNQSSKEFDREALRQELEARKIIDIQQGLGINFRDEEKEEIQRGIQMEVRDQQEKAEWEQSNGYQ